MILRQIPINNTFQSVQTLLNNVGVTTLKSNCLIYLHFSVNITYKENGIELTIPSTASPKIILDGPSFLKGEIKGASTSIITLEIQTLV